LVTISVRSKQAPPALWDLEQRRLITELEGHVGRVFTARFVASGREILTAGADGTARLWSAATGSRRQVFRGDSHFLADATLAPDGSTIVAGGSDGLLRFWDVSSGRLLWTLQAHKSYVIGVHYEGDEIDLTPLVHEQIILALPTRPLCGESCRGLCPRCGANLNAGACGCPAAPPDPRLAVLLTMRGK